ncbi:MAG TPA: DegV family protein [Candidatus Baltobacteraceae bacterium]|nr:DegV family protein [Candidatus Baltobacteraceae bacterium]
MAVTIITDSGSDLSIPEAARLGIGLVPVWILFGEERFRDGIDIDRATFFKRLQNGEAPKTEPATEEQFREAFARVVSAGNDGVMISVSSGISKSYELATNAAKTFGGRIHVVDSLGASGLETLLALYAAELAKSGAPASEIAKRVDPREVRHTIYFGVPDLTMLGRSGRLPKALVALGSMLNVSLILKMNDQGAVGPAGQSFSFDKACEIMVEAVVRAVAHSPNARVAFGHVQAESGAQNLRGMLEAKLGHPPAQDFVYETSLTIAANVGPGAVGISAIVP